MIAEYLQRRQEVDENANPEDSKTQNADENEISSQTRIANLLERILPSVTDYVDFIIQ